MGTPVNDACFHADGESIESRIHQKVRRQLYSRPLLNVILQFWDSVAMSPILGIWARLSYGPFETCRLRVVNGSTLLCQTVQRMTEFRTHGRLNPKQNEHRRTTV